MKFQARWRLAALAGLAALAALSACAADREIVTPTGAVTGQVAGPFVVLGVAFKATSTGNRPNATPVFSEFVDLDVPAGTELIVPTLTGFDLGFGSTDPEDHAPQMEPGATFTWHSADHHYGLGRIDVVVRDLDALAPGATTQHARLEVRAILTDNNADDPWWGVIRYHLIFLGRPQTP